MVGKSWGSSGSAAGQSFDFVRLLYIIRLYLSLLFRRQAGIEYNYMLCIIAWGCFFLAHFRHGGGSWSAWFLFCLLQKVWQKKTTEGLIARRQAKRLCKPRGMRGEDFCLPVIVQAELPVIYYQVKPDRFVFIYFKCFKNINRRNRNEYYYLSFI